MKLFGWDIELKIRRSHNSVNCVGCVLEIFRADCPNAIGDRYIDKHYNGGPEQAACEHPNCICLKNAKDVFENYGETL